MLVQLSWQSSALVMRRSGVQVRLPAPLGSTDSIALPTLKKAMLWGGDLAVVNKTMSSG